MSKSILSVSLSLIFGLALISAFLLGQSDEYGLAYAQTKTGPGHNPILERPRSNGETGTNTYALLPVSSTLTIDQTITPAEAAVGQTITYTYLITNTTGQTITNLQATNQPLGPVSFPPGTLLVNQLLADQSISGILTYTVQESDLPGPLTSLTTISSTLPSGRITSAQVTGTVALRKQPQGGPIYLPLVMTPNLDCPTIPTLISPANGATVDSLIPTLTWDSGNESKAIAAELEIERIGSGSTNEIWSSYWKTGVRTHIPSGNLENGQTYRWRVRLDCGETWGDYSAQWTFTPSYDGAVVAAPQLVSPAYGSLVDSTTVTLKWSAVPGATFYTVYLTESDFPFFYPFFTTPNTEETIDFYFDSDTTYLWRVVARDDKAYGPVSETWEFTTPQ